VEEGKLADVLCRDALEYEGVDLLGMPLSDVRQILGQEDGVGEGVGEGIAVYYEELGLTLWVTDDTVQNATCAAPDLDE